MRNRVANATAAHFDVLQFHSRLWPNVGNASRYDAHFPNLEHGPVEMEAGLGLGLTRIPRHRDTSRSIVVQIWDHSSERGDPCRPPNRTSILTDESFEEQKI